MSVSEENKYPEFRRIIMENLVDSLSETLEDVTRNISGGVYGHLEGITKDVALYEMRIMKETAEECNRN